MKYIYLLLVTIFLISCNNKQDKEQVRKAKPLMSSAQNHKATEIIKPVYLKDVNDWKELKQVDSFFVKYRKISPNEALSNAIELKDLVKRLKDSVKPIKFEIPSLNARINILNNEVLRLADLIDIAAIKADEVNAQVDKTMAAFSDINTKINTILTKNNFENEIDIDVSFIGLDTTKIDSISKKSIDLRLKEKLLIKSEEQQVPSKKQ